ncbi:MAG TPA: tail fiber protein [Wenzhouxiangellaceae bacterium]|nr:tail fiber protein [Wenzhouxiangellaceae bacterium]
MVGFNFAPRGWAFCDGKILPINQRDLGVASCFMRQLARLY